MTHETEISAFSTSAEFVRQIIPDHYELFWQDSDILNGNEHDIIHHLMVFGLANYIGKQLIAKGKNIDLLALDAAALIHDTQRISEDTDVYHGVAAQMYLQTESNKLWPFTSFFTASPDSLALASKIVLFHNTKLQETPSHLKKNLTYRVFKFCDALAMVRYNHWDGKFEVTPELLNKKLPGIFTTEQLKYLLSQTQNWHELAQQYRRSGLDQTTAIIRAGVETEFFT